VIEQFGSHESEGDPDGLRPGSHIWVFEVATSQPVLNQPLARLAEPLLPPKLLRDLNHPIGQSRRVQFGRPGEPLDFVYECPEHLERVF